MLAVGCVEEAKISPVLTSTTTANPLLALAVSTALAMATSVMC